MSRRCKRCQKVSKGVRRCKRVYREVKPRLAFYWCLISAIPLCPQGDMASSHQHSSSERNVACSHPSKNNRNVYLSAWTMSKVKFFWIWQSIKDGPPVDEWTSSVFWVSMAALTSTCSHCGRNFPGFCTDMRRPYLSSRGGPHWSTQMYYLCLVSRRMNMPCDTCSIAVIYALMHEYHRG